MAAKSIEELRFSHQKMNEEFTAKFEELDHKIVARGESMRLIGESMQQMMAAFFEKLEQKLESALSPTVPATHKVFEERSPPKSLCRVETQGAEGVPEEKSSDLLDASGLIATNADFCSMLPAINSVREDVGGLGDSENTALKTFGNVIEPIQVSEFSSFEDGIQLVAKAEQSFPSKFKVVELAYQMFDEMTQPNDCLSTKIRGLDVHQLFVEGPVKLSLELIEENDDNNSVIQPIHEGKLSFATKINDLEIVCHMFDEMPAPFTVKHDNGIDGHEELVLPIFELRRMSGCDFFDSDGVKQVFDKMFNDSIVELGVGKVLLFIFDPGGGEPFESTGVTQNLSKSSENHYQNSLGEAWEIKHAVLQNICSSMHLRNQGKMIAHAPVLPLEETFDSRWVHMPNEGCLLLFLGVVVREYMETQGEIPCVMKIEDRLIIIKAIKGVPRINHGCNPAAWILEITSLAEEIRLGLDLAEIYHRSALFKQNNELVDSLSQTTNASKELSFQRKYSKTFITQCLACLYKQLVSLWRNPQYTAVRFFYTVIISMGCMYSAVLYIRVTNVMSVQPVVAMERSVAYIERAAGMYYAVALASAQVAIEFPYVLVQTLVYSTIFYFMASFELNLWKLIWYMYFVYCTFLYFTLFGMMMTAVTPNQNMAAILGPPFYLMWDLFSGFINFFFFEYILGDKDGFEREGKRMICKRMLCKRIVHGYMQRG